VLIDDGIVSIASGDLVVGRPVGIVTVDLPTDRPFCVGSGDR